MKEHIITSRFVRSSSTAQISLLFIAVMWALSGSAVGQESSTFIQQKNVSQRPFVHFFKTLPRRDWYIANHPNLSDWNDATYSRYSIKLLRDQSRLEINLTPLKTSKTSLINYRNKRFRGGSIQRKHLWGYGRYEVVMKAAKGSGAVSAFFTYTGPYFSTPHDEIDFEFLGRDTSKVWVNMYTGGKSYFGRTIELGFDAAEDAALYAFEWRPDSVMWYAGSKLIHKVTSNEAPIPRHGSKIIANLWVANPKMKAWAGVAAKDLSTTASFYCISYRPFNIDAKQCSDTYAVKGVD